MEKVISIVATRKATALDNVTAEMLEASKEYGLDKIMDLRNHMHNAWYLPQDIKTNIYRTCKVDKMNIMYKLQNDKIKDPCNKIAA